MMAKIRGKVRRVGLEGGLWALYGDDGQQYHLVDAPEGLKTEGLRVEIEGEVPSGASIGMVGSILKVRSYRAT